MLLPADAAVARRKGRPAGKRSDPAWKPYTVLIRKETHKAVSRRLQDMDVGQDLSELVDELLTEWMEALSVFSLQIFEFSDFWTYGNLYV